MASPTQIVYTAHATATGGRDGRATSDDGKLDVALARPKEMGGNGAGTNPEQLFAAGYSACFLGAMGFVAAQNKQFLPAGTQISSDVGIGCQACNVRQPRHLSMPPTRSAPTPTPRGATSPSTSSWSDGASRGAEPQPTASGIGPRKGVNLT